MKQSLLLLLFPASLLAWNGDPTPFDQHHLIRIQPNEFSKATAKNAEAVFGNVLPITGELKTSLRVRYSGEYILWVRVAQLRTSMTPLNVSIRQGGKELVKQSICSDSGAKDKGGPAGFTAYQEVALKTTPDGKTNEGGDGITGQTAKDTGIEVDAGDFLAELGQKKSWANMLRVESPKGDRPFHWWRVGKVKLPVGSFDFRIAPDRQPAPGSEPLLDAVFLTTADNIQYPFLGDISAARSSFIRFRMDQLPEDGTVISVGMRVHYDPWSTGRGWLNPDGFDAKNAAPHTKTGFTRWYRLQDLERAPGMGGGESHLQISIRAGLDQCKGATQFAVFPHQDSVLREISWNEPEGTNISMATDFENHLHKLRTFRDHARENYEKALRASGEKLFPLTRGPLYFSNSWGGARDSAHEYMVKTLRLLGFNSVGAPFDPVRSSRNYGWTLQGGHYWPPSFMPYDEPEAVKKYDNHYRNNFKKNEAMYERMSIFQIADEPGEINKTEMSAPLWRYESKDGSYWMDHSGNSELNSRTDLHDCVLEGQLSTYGLSTTIRAAIDDAKHPTKYVSWSFGRVGPSLTVNFAVNKVGYVGGGRGMMSKPGATISKKTPFKIVFEGGKAALYVRDRLLHQHDGLPNTGGFGFAGPPKSVHALRIREIKKDEHIIATSIRSISGFDDRKSSDDLGLDDLDLEDENAKPDWLDPLPLKEMVEKHWFTAGGIPEAHKGFRKWAAQQGLSPSFFGAKAWNEVRLMTVPALATTKEDARLFYWSRRYSGWLTPRMFKLSADAIHRAAPNKDMLGFVALSGHSLYFPSQQPLDMFHLANEGYPLMPGISDWMSFGSWRWDSHQAVAFSIAPYNAGARRYGAQPVSFPMMHCVWPSEFRATTMLANNTKFISYFNYGPDYMVTEGFWSNGYGGYVTTSNMHNRAAQVDDILAPGVARPSRVAMLYARSTEYWNAQSSFTDKRAAFLGLAHEYFQPELVTEEQIDEGALAHYDALYVLDKWVKKSTQENILKWTREGGLLWACTDAATRNEYNDELDLLKELDVQRRFAEVTPDTKRTRQRMSPVEGQVSFRPHQTNTVHTPETIDSPHGVIRARYDDGRTAWLESPAGKGKLVYLGHRCGHAYTSRAFRIGGTAVIWANTAREPLTTPLHEAAIERELVLSEPCIVASPISTKEGTVIPLYNMRGGAAKELHISLKEANAPHSVQTFEGTELIPLEFDYRDGRVEVSLDKLGGATMILVRRSPQPQDDRRKRMATRAEEMLASGDWEDVSAGAWFSGFESSDVKHLIPLLAHPRWEVRRSAVEAMGRIGSADRTPVISNVLRTAIGDALIDFIGKESDAHALGDALRALGRTGHKSAETICSKHLSHNNWFIRSQSLRALEASSSHNELSNAAEHIDTGLSDPDLRVRTRAISLLGKTDPVRTVESTVKCWKGERDPLEQSSWADALTGNEDAVSHYLTSGMPGPDALFLSIASRHANPQIEAKLADRIRTKKFTSEHHFSYAVMRQHSSALTRQLFDIRNELPKRIQHLLPKILEVTFNAGLGNSLQDWSDWLAK